MEEEGLKLARLHIPRLGRSYIRALLREGYDDEKCLQQLSEEELGKIVPERLSGRIKRRLNAENHKVQTVTCVSSPPPCRGRIKVGVSLNTNDQQLTTNPSCNSQLASYTLQPVLEIDTHRPDRIIFEGKEVKVTTIGFSLICLLAQHRGQVMSYEDIIKKLWRAETDAIYTRIIQHIYKFRRDILDIIGNNKTNKEKVKDIFKVVSGRGVMLNINDTELKIN